ncbi:hypothetical protein Peur_056330 [Populus x canadensis]
MARKRKVESSAAIVDESDKVLYSVFGNFARNSLNYTLKLSVIRCFHLKLDKDMLFPWWPVKMNLSFTTPVRQSQDKNKNLCYAFDSEMDTTPEGSVH